MSEFTKAEIERINQLYGNDFEGITPEDAKLIGRYEAAKAIAEQEYRAKIEAINIESANAIKNANEKHEQAMANLNELHEQALARLNRLEVLNNGE